MCTILSGLPKVASYPAYQNSIVLKYERFKLKLRVFLAGYSVAMVTYCVTKTIVPYLTTKKQQHPVLNHFYFLIPYTLV